MRIVVRLVLILLGAWIVVCLLAFLLQRRMQYFPDRTRPATPRDPRFPSIEEVTLESEDGVRLLAWFAPGPRDETLLVLHGNGGNRADRLAWMAPLHERGWGVFLLDWRGYGGSEGSPTEEGFHLDARAAADWLRARGHRRIVVVGESIGCGPAVRLASEQPITGLVLQGGTPSIADVARHHYPYLPMGLLLKDRFDVRDVAPLVTSPALVIHGDLDNIVPLPHGRALADALGGATTLWVVDGASHNDVDLVAGSAYTDRVHAFLESLP